MSDPLNSEIKQAIVQCLRLPTAPESIGDAAPLFGPDGIGLDSIDVLELVLELERSFGVTIADQETGMQVLQSVDTIAAFVRSSRTSQP
jgi:acyl carrier protein